MSQPDVPIRTWIARCRTCAGAIYERRAPSPAYAERVARQLFVTGAHETGFRLRRQRQRDGTLYPRSSTAGAFSVFQMESAGIREGIRMLARPGLKHHVDTYLLERGSQTIPNVDSDECWRWVLRKLQEPEGDFIALALARLYYLRVPAAIPKTVGQMALYAKEHWNTYAGKATVLDYAGACGDLLWELV